MVTFRRSCGRGVGAGNSASIQRLGKRGVEIMTVLASLERYRIINWERMGNAEEEMGRTPPERNKVIFGCVGLNGDVETEATDIEVPSRSSGTETMNGREGTERSNEEGTGFTTDAIACNTIVLDLEEMWKAFTVMKSEAEGRGTLCPGCGKPGNGGT